jgi:hypothetical protein
LEVAKCQCGSKYPIDLLKDAGVDMTTDEPLRSSLQAVFGVTAADVLWWTRTHDDALSTAHGASGVTAVLAPILISASWSYSK